MTNGTNETKKQTLLQATVENVGLINVIRKTLEESVESFPSMVETPAYKAAEALHQRLVSVVVEEQKKKGKPTKKPLTALAVGTKASGTVKYAPEKGFCHLTVKDHLDMFIHVGGVVQSLRSQIIEGATLDFTVAEGKEGICGINLSLHEDVKNVPPVKPAAKKPAVKKPAVKKLTARTVTQKSLDKPPAQPRLRLVASAAPEKPMTTTALEDAFAEAGVLN
ncbi:MAG: cold shock CspA family protein [Acidimicrobiales bacterium]|jgi:cold shock CspA family protein